jgi:hypothetical protein
MLAMGIIMSADVNIRDLLKRRKARKRKSKKKVEYPTNDKKSVILKPDDDQTNILVGMVKAQSLLRHHIVDWRDRYHVETGRYPTLAELTKAGAAWKKGNLDIKVLPEGALQATARLVLRRSIKAAREYKAAVWNKEPVSLYFTGNGQHEYIKLANHQIRLPKLGWVDWKTPKGLGLTLQAVMESPGSRVRGVTVRYGSTGEYYAKISFARATEEAVEKSIHQMYVKGFEVKRIMRSELVSRKEAERRYTELYETDDTPYVVADDNEDYDPDDWPSGPPDARKLLEYVLSVFHIPGTLYGLCKAEAVSTIKACLKREYFIEARRLLRHYGVKAHKQRLDGKVCWVYRVYDITDAIMKYDEEQAG